MKITGCKINNYKSIGSEKNLLLVESNVTALIGKNESGKSNVLEAIGNLSFLAPIKAAYLNNKNRGEFGEVSIIVELEFYEKELEEFNINQSKTRVKFMDSSTVNVEGGLSELLQNDELLVSTVEEIIKLKNDRKIWGTDASRLKSIIEYIDCLKDIYTKIYPNYMSNLNNLKTWISNLYEDKVDLIQKLEFIQSSIEKYYNMLPQIYYRKNDQQLDSSYRYDDIKNILKDQNHIFYRFLLAARIDEDEIVKAFENISKGQRQTTRNAIKRKIKNNIEDRFNEFYRQEKIEIQVEFENNVLEIYILTDDKAMNLSERSNGLRWYLSLFVDVLSHDYKDSSVIYLLDEPGVYLHVNAQKELLNLFDNLANRGNQVIYTTHSPYMIDNQDILNVRAIEKDDSGITKIFKSAYDQKLSLKSKMETLSPLVEALGADLKYNIGPSSERNIITEGISDYMYIKAMLNYLKFEKHPNVIPSAGVHNIHNLVSIAIGWGLEFNILLDYDAAGVKEYKTLVDKLDSSLKEKIYFVNCATEIQQNQYKTNPKTIESLINKIDFQKLSTPFAGSNNTKVLAAKEFHDKVINGELELEEETILKFKELFKSLKIINNN
jgi:predicted ATP-dependent endonuclease of OLD family